MKIRKVLGWNTRAETPEAEISKQDLLRETGISYGQFYRWKRMGLIPEEWFRRRATFTGQETFLPKRKLLERIARIQELKDAHSLEEIADMLSPESVQRGYGPEELAVLGISPGAQALLPGAAGRELRFLDLVCLLLIEQCQAQRVLTAAQMRLAAETLLARFAEVSGGTAERFLAVLVCEGVTVVALYNGTCGFDARTTVLARLPLHQLVEDVKMRLSRIDA
jgi:DNA-binding transcriptional MerR regulator